MLELPPELEAHLSAGHTLVVPTAQRAAAVRIGFAHRQLARGQRAFRTPDVQSLNGWLRGQRPRTALRRLSASEEWLLWQDAVREAATGLGVPCTGTLVDGIRQSVAVLSEWCIAPEELQHAPQPEAALLSAALSAIDARLADRAALAPWRVLADLARDPPQRIPAFAGFSAVTPARRALLAAWAERGTPAPEYACAFTAATPSLARAADPGQELHLMAGWCRARLFRDPAARLLVIVPDLGERRAEVRRVFDAVLDPDFLHQGAGETEPAVYALEGGQALLDYALIGECLRTLRVLSSEVDVADVSQWLRGASWLKPAAPQRAQLDVWLRSVAPPRLTAAQLVQHLRAASGPLLPIADAMACAIEPALELLAGSVRLGMGSWSERFSRVLQHFALHAQAARQHSSHTQQVLLRLAELLQEGAALPVSSGLFSAAQAVGTFAQLLARTRFEPATGDAAVTITASLADPILRYDGIWAGGLHAGALPQGVRFDPFIPAALQRRAGILAADPAALVTQAQDSLSTLWRSSAQFIVSAPEHADDLELAAAPLLAPFAGNAYVPEAACDALSAAVRRSGEVETYRDELGAAWPQGMALPAGTRAIELQSRCPFRAYAELRLGAGLIEEPAPGISPRERGSMLHRALQLLWQRLDGSSGLAAARSSAGLADAIGECVTQAASEILENPAHTDATGVLELRRAAVVREGDRARRLISALCEVETRRAPFTVVELETEHHLRIAGALINMRIDRLDRLADGSHAILDYKSGRAVSPDWEAERTTHPQLLVYLLAVGVPVSALAVAHLDPKAVVLKGIADQSGRLPGIKGLAAPDADTAAADASWDRQIGAWRAQVTQLVADFAQGVARVDPAAGACDHCHLHALCRIADLALDDADADADRAAVP